MKIYPLDDRVLVKTLEEAFEQKTASGLVIPDTAKEKPRIGDVIEVGPGKLLDNGNVHPLDVKVGDKVLFSKYGGDEIEIDDDKYLILQRSDILGKVEL